MTTKHIIGPTETAQRIGVDRKTLYNWLKKGQCPVAPIPGMNPPRWRAADVEAFLAGDRA